MARQFIQRGIPPEGTENWCGYVVARDDSGLETKVTCGCKPDQQPYLCKRHAHDFLGSSK